jgi:hypothetical protein
MSEFLRSRDSSLSNASSAGGNGGLPPSISPPIDASDVVNFMDSSGRFMSPFDMIMGNKSGGIIFPPRCWLGLILMVDVGPTFPFPFDSFCHVNARDHVSIQSSFPWQTNITSCCCGCSGSWYRTVNSSSVGFAFTNERSGLGIFVGVVNPMQGWVILNYHHHSQ